MIRRHFRQEIDARSADIRRPRRPYLPTRRRPADRRVRPLYACPVNPLGLYGVESWALFGQQAADDPHPSCSALFDLPVMRGDPLSNLCADVPACVVPDQHPNLLARRLELLAAPKKEPRGYRAHGTTVHETHPHLLKLGHIKPVAGDGLRIVRSLILANTLMPPRRILRLSKIFLALLPLVPAGWLRALREQGLARAFYGVPSVPQEDQAFWHDYQHGLMSRLSKGDLGAMYRLGIDLVESFRFASDDLASWPRRILVLEADEDPVTPEMRAELRRCYPQAEVYTIHGAGHTPWMSHKEEYLSVIKEFLAGGVPEPSSGPSLEQRLQVFRRTHPYRKIDVDGLRWRYVVGGEGGRTILLPSGGARVPDVYLLLFETLEPHFRIISPAYPAAHTMAALVEGLAAVLDAEGADNADLFGSSFGGFVAQCFVRRYPERVRSLVLANTGAP